MSPQILNWIRWFVLFGCWGAFGVVWVAGAIYNAVKAPAIVRRSDTPFQTLLLGAVLALAIFFIVPAGVWKVLTVHAAWLVILGAIVLVASTIFTLWARFVLGTMWTATAAAKSGHVLHTEGPYAITRHPIYTGLLGMFLGTTLLSGLGPYLIYLAIAVAVVELKLRSEERLLTATLGEQYLRYQQRVPQLIPWLRMGPSPRWLDPFRRTK
jgi:protein-S-isoprenylcysteine O-methyltransferase Ste14